MEVGQEGSLREGLEAAVRERVREIIEMVLQQEVEATLGARRSQRVAERVGYRHGAGTVPNSACIRLSSLAARYDPKVAFGKSQSQVDGVLRNDYRTSSWPAYRSEI
jgi:hypothetical protein